jgi:hypothetical protein
MNNGRPENAKGFISKVDVTSGKFSTENLAIKTFKDTSEKQPFLNLNSEQEH